MPRGKAPTFELQRATILQTAAQLFAEKGYASTSMADLATACGMSKALLYHYYRDKEHILFDTADSYMDTLIAIVAEVAHSDCRRWSTSRAGRALHAGLRALAGPAHGAGAGREVSGRSGTRAAS